MKSAIRIGLIALVCLLAALGIALALSENARLLLAVALQFDPGPPPIAGNIHCHDWQNCESASRQFDEAVARRFPRGTPQQALEAALLEQNFARDPHMPKTCTPKWASAAVGVLTITCPDWDARWDPKDELVYHWGRFPCGNTVGVRWSADRLGRIVHREGYYYFACL
ncbi:MAG: hypothetical protein WDN08_16125 [Rhizomicrobium sp.]